MKIFLVIILSLSISLSYSKDLKGFGYWVYGGDMDDIDLNALSNKGTTDIFLNYLAFKTHGESELLSWIMKANNLNIRIHVWMHVFYNGVWINPEEIDTNIIVQDAKKYASIQGISGIHFDYLRYPENAYQYSHGAEKINLFIKVAVAAIHSINPKIIVSASLMPETTKSEYLYGQNYEVFSTYFDAVLPMIFKGDNKKTSAWIQGITEWFVQNSKGASVWAGIQSYRNKNDFTPLSESALTIDIKSALSGNPDGIILFRYGVSELLDFKSLE